MTVLGILSGCQSLRVLDRFAICHYSDRWLGVAAAAIGFLVSLLLPPGARGLFQILRPNMKLLILIIYFVNFIFSAYCPFKKRVNLVFIFQVSMGLMIYLPYVLFSDQFSSQSGFANLQTSLLLAQIALSISLLLITVLFNITNFGRLLSARRSVDFRTSLKYLRGAWRIGILITVSYILIIPGGLSNLPLVQSINGADPTSIMLAREETFKLLDPHWNSGPSSLIFYPLLAFRYIAFPLIVLCAIQFRHLFRGSDSTISNIACSCALFLLVANGQRAPLPAMLIRCILLILSLQRFNRQKLILFSVLLPIPIALVPLLVTVQNYAAGDTSFGLSLFLTRLTLTPFQDLLDYYNAFPDHWPFLNGQTILKPFLHLIGHKYFYIENEMCFFSNPHAIDSCHSNAAYLSNLWADFGFEGVFFGTLLTSCVIGLLDYTLRSDLNSFDLTIYSFLSYTVIVLAFGSITSVLGTNGGFLAIVSLYNALRSSLKVNRRFLNHSS